MLYFFPLKYDLCAGELLILTLRYARIIPCVAVYLDDLNGLVCRLWSSSALQEQDWVTEGHKAARATAQCKWGGAYSGPGSLLW